MACLDKRSKDQFVTASLECQRSEFRRALVREELKGEERLRIEKQ